MASSAQLILIDRLAKETRTDLTDIDRARLTSLEASKLIDRMKADQP